MAAGTGKWDANARAELPTMSAAWADERMPFQIGMRWILLFSVTSWVIIAGFVF